MIAERHDRLLTPAELMHRLETFPWAEWNASLAGSLMQPYRDLVVSQATKASAAAGDPIQGVDPMMNRFMTEYIGERVVQLNGTTKADVIDTVRGFLAAEGTDAATQETLGELVLGKVRERFDGYEAWRAERIARTESAIAYNHGNILGYSQAGVEQVTVLDGTEDEICEGANGKKYSLAEALSDPIGHPNCTRSFAPIVDDKQARRKQIVLHILATDDLLPIACAVKSEYLTGLDDPCDARELDPIDEEDHELLEQPRDPKTGQWIGNGSSASSAVGGAFDKPGETQSIAFTDAKEMKSFNDAVDADIIDRGFTKINWERRGKYTGDTQKIYTNPNEVGYVHTIKSKYPKKGETGTIGITKYNVEPVKQVGWID